MAFTKKYSRLVESVIKDRGEAYFRQRRVNVVKGSARSLTATVRGTSNYEISLSLTTGFRSVATAPTTKRTWRCASTSGPRCSKPNVRVIFLPPLTPGLRESFMEKERTPGMKKTRRDLADAIINADNSLIRNLVREDLELLLS